MVLQAISLCLIMSQFFSFHFSKYKKVYSLIERMEMCYSLEKVEKKFGNPLSKSSHNR